MNCHAMPRIIPTVFERLPKITAAASRAGKSVTVVRHPSDGGSPDWHSPVCRSIIADLSHPEGRLTAHDFVDHTCDVLIFTLAADRSASPFTYAPGEVNLVNDLFWRRAGAAGRLSYSPLP